MNRATAFNTLAQAFKVWIAANQPSLVNAVSYPDLDFTPPAPGNPWIRWTMAWSGSVNAGVGMTEDRHTGMIFVELYWPAATSAGYRDVNAIADQIADYYRTYTADGGRLRCAGPDKARPSVSTPPREAAYTRRTVEVPVRLHEFV